MSFVLTKKLPTPMEIKELYPVSEELAALKAEKDQELIDIITGASDKFMVIIGPCSADNEEAVCDYIGRLTKVQEKVKDNPWYNWVSIICEDGTGICFSGSDIYYPSYGKLDTDGAITDGYGDITWDFDANSYTYTPRQ